MTPTPDNSQHVRRVVLPSGRTIEVVYFGREPMAPESERELHVCLRCESDLVYPLEWEEAGPTHWSVELRCPNCEWRASGIFAQAQVERFDEALDRATESVTRDLKRLMHVNMEDEVDRFVAALRDDHIVPFDF